MGDTHAALLYVTSLSCTQLMQILVLYVHACTIGTLKSPNYGNGVVLLSAFPALSIFGIIHHFNAVRNSGMKDTGHTILVPSSVYTEPKLCVWKIQL